MLQDEERLLKSGGAFVRVIGSSADVVPARRRIFDRQALVRTPLPHFRPVKVRLLNVSAPVFYPNADVVIVEVESVQFKEL